VHGQSNLAIHLKAQSSEAADEWLEAIYAQEYVTKVSQGISVPSAPVTKASGAALSMYGVRAEGYLHNSNIANASRSSGAMGGGGPSPMVRALPKAAPVKSPMLQQGGVNKTSAVPGGANPFGGGGGGGGVCSEPLRGKVGGEPVRMMAHFGGGCAHHFFMYILSLMHDTSPSTLHASCLFYTARTSLCTVTLPPTAMVHASLMVHHGAQ
jgi:hypothetical protein